jgi:hypothetical protein
MSKNSTIGDGVVPRSRNRSGGISSGNKNVPVSGIRAMNGCGNILLAM